MPSTPQDLPHLILFKASKMLKGVISQGFSNHVLVCLCGLYVFFVCFFFVCFISIVYIFLYYYLCICGFFLLCYFIYFVCVFSISLSELPFFFVCLPVVYLHYYYCNKFEVWCLYLPPT